MVKSYFFISLVVFLFSCQDDKKIKSYAISDEDYTSIVANSVDRDWEEIKEDGVLRALVVYSSTSYFLYRGEPMGFEYELLSRLADDLNLKLEIIVSENLDSEFDVLNRGEVDLIAHGMTITNQRKQEVDFTEYLYLTKQVLVQKKPDNFRRLSWGSLQRALIHDAIELTNDTVSIRRNSAYFERVLSLSNEIGAKIVIDTLNSALTTDEIIDKVADGEIKYTIADENLAKINASYRPILDVSVPISFSQRIAWVTRKKSKNFKSLIDGWIKSQRKKTDYYVIYNKYFENKRSFQRRIKSEYYSLGENQISPYDKLFKIYASNIGWDWRLLASQAYQESRFDTKAQSWAGAQGLLQVMPATGKALGITDPSNPEQSIRGGVKYLKQNYQELEKVRDSINRIKLTLAAYNCGLGHVLDAQRLTSAEGLNPNAWDDVAPKLLALRFPRNFNKPIVKYGYVRGTEPVKYVNQIFERYEHYQTFALLEEDEPLVEEIIASSNVFTTTAE